jgi:hypothetical protein
MGSSRRGSPFWVGGLVVFTALLLSGVLFALGLGHLAEKFSSGLLFLGPALLLAIVLFGRRYPGERVIERWRDARRLRAPRSTAATAQPRPCLRCGAGRLIAESLAGRAPPLAAGC